MQLNSFEGTCEILGGERRVTYLRYDDGAASLSLVVKDEAEAHGIVAFLESKKVATLWAHAHPGLRPLEESTPIKEDAAAPEVIKRTRRRRAAAPETNGVTAHTTIQGGLFQQLDGESTPVVETREPEVVAKEDATEILADHAKPSDGGLLEETVRKIEAESAADDPEWMQDEPSPAEPPAEEKPAPKPKRTAAKPKTTAEPATAVPVEDAPPVDVGDVPEKLVGAKRLIEVITYLQEQGATDAVSIMKGVHELRPKVPLLNRIPAEQLAERVKRTLEMYGG